MAGINLHAMFSSFARFLCHGNCRSFFARRRRFGSTLRRHGRGAVFRRYGHTAVFRRRGCGAAFRCNGNGSGLRHRAGLGDRRHPFVSNHPRRGGRRHGHPRYAFPPRTGCAAQAAAVNAHGVHAAPAAPPSPPAPLQPAFHIPPMDWLLGEPAAALLGEEDGFVAALAPQPYPAYFPGAFFNPPSPTPSAELEEFEFPPGLGPDAYMDLPTPTPALSDEDPEHFMPLGYGPAPELDSPPPDEEAGAPPAAALLAFDLNRSTSRPSPRTRRHALPSLPRLPSSTFKSRSSLRTRSRLLRLRPHL